MTKNQVKVFEKIKSKLSSLLNVVDVDDITGETNTNRCHINKLAQFEITEFLELSRDLLKK